MVRPATPKPARHSLPTKEQSSACRPLFEQQVDRNAAALHAVVFYERANGWPSGKAPDHRATTQLAVYHWRMPRILWAWRLLTFNCKELLKVISQRWLLSALIFRMWLMFTIAFR